MGGVPFGGHVPFGFVAVWMRQQDGSFVVGSLYLRGSLSRGSLCRDDCTFCRMFWSVICSTFRMSGFLVVVGNFWNAIVCMGRDLVAGV